jgi:hypothetical protein
MRFLIGHSEINATEEFLSPRCLRTERRLAVPDMNRIINVALCFGHGILLYPEGGYIAPISTGRTRLQLRDNAAGAAAFIAVWVASLSAFGLLSVCGLLIAPFHAHAYFRTRESAVAVSDAQSGTLLYG